MQSVRCSESEGSRDKPLGWRATPQRKNLQPDFPGFADTRPSAPAHAQRRPCASGNGDDAIDNLKTDAGLRRPSAHDGKTASVRALFGAAKESLCRKDEAAPQPPRRRRGETGRGFVAACRLLLRRLARTNATARGRYAALQPTREAQEAFAPADFYARAATYLSDTLDWLNLWQDNADNDCWPDDEFDAKQEDYFPQP